LIKVLISDTAGAGNQHIYDTSNDPAPTAQKQPKPYLIEIGIFIMFLIPFMIFIFFGMNLAPAFIGSQ